MAPGGRNKKRHVESAPTQDSNSLPSQTSSNLANLSPPDSNADSSATRSTRRRGETLGIAVLKARRAGRKLKVRFGDDTYRPIEGDAANFTSQVSTIMKQILPADCPGRKHFKEEDLEEIYERLSNDFDIDNDDPHTKIAVNNMIQFLHSQWRCRNKKHYENLIKQGKDARATHPKKVTAEQWAKLCNRYEQEDYKALCAKNSENRKKVKVNHVSGSKSFVRLAHELNLKDNRVELYKESHHTKPKGDDPGHWIDEEAEGRYNWMCELQSESTIEGTPSLSHHDIANQVLGTRPGYICGLGNGVKPKTSFKSGQQTRVDLQEEIQRTVNSMREEMTDEIRNEVREEMRNELMDELRAELQADMDARIAAAISRINMPNI